MDGAMVLNPLHLAAQSGHVQIVELLLRKGALPEGFWGTSGLDSRVTSLIDKLSNYQQKTEIMTRMAGPMAEHSLPTPLLLAAATGKMAAVRSLLAAGADPNK